jgi:hypothetical protein
MPDLSWFELQPGPARHQLLTLFAATAGAAAGAAAGINCWVQHLPFYKLVVAQQRAPRDGKHLDVVGWYNPIPGAQSATAHVAVAS